MSGILHSKAEDLPIKHNCRHEDYEFYRRDFVPPGNEGQTLVCIYEVPPHKSAFPYHYHHKNEETYYIISGEGLLKTPEGDRKVSAGDCLFFPANAQGAHKLTNISETENLVYIDFDVTHDIDIAVYPDSDKIGIWGKGIKKEINRVYNSDDNVDYYKGE